MLITESQLRKTIRQLLKEEEHRIKNSDLENAFYDLAAVISSPKSVDFVSAYDGANALIDVMTPKERKIIVDFITLMKNGKDINSSQYNKMTNALNSVNTKLMMGKEHKEQD